MAKQMVHSEVFLFMSKLIQNYSFTFPPGKTVEYQKEKPGPGDFKFIFKELEAGA